MKKSYHVAVLVTIVIICAAVVSWRYWHRSSVANKLPPDGFVAAKWVLDSNRVTYETRPTAGTIDSIEEAFKDAVLNKLGETAPLSSSLTSSQMTDFADVTANRLRLFLVPDLDEWINVVVRESFQESDRTAYEAPVVQNRPSFLNGLGPTPEFVDLWTASTENSDLAPLSLDDVSVRALWIDGREIAHEGEPRLTIGSICWGDYRTPSDPKTAGMTAYEALVPIIYRHMGSKDPDLKTVLGIAYRWDQEYHRWAPLHIKQYSHIPLNGTVQVPYY